MSMIEMTNGTFAKSLYQTATQHTITIPYNTGWDMFIYNEGKEDMAPYYKQKKCVCNISYLLNNELQETTGIAKLSFVSFFIQTNVFSDDFRAKNYCEK